MLRPYFNFGVAQLESLYETHKSSPEILTLLRDELSLRTTPRARQLLSDVQALLSNFNVQQTEQQPPTPDPLVTADFPVLEPEASPNIQQHNFPPIPPLTGNALSSPLSASAGESGRRSAILEYWRAVEIFNPQQTPRIDPRSAVEPTYECQPDGPAPWEAGHVHRTRRSPSNCLWRFIVYGGIFQTRLISEKLEETFGRDPEVFDERMDGSAGVFSIALTHRGEPLIESFVLSSAAWALGRLKNPSPTSPDWLSGFEFVESHIRKYLESLFLEPSEDHQDSFPIGRAVTSGELIKVCQRVLEHLGLDEHNFSPRLIVRCQPVSYKKYKSADDLDVLNSFYIRDLQRVANAVAKGNCGRGLASYLQQPDSGAEARVDVRQQEPMAFCWDVLQPQKFPVARWPSAGYHPLVYSQQIAVNEMFARLNPEGGLFGINGPPGTGKTTLLRDVVTAVIVERAKALAKLSRADEAFTTHENWKTAGYNRRINVLRESLRGHEMVVASANNGAVENVTLELPNCAAVDEFWNQEVDHFKDQASRLLNAPAWGLIAARLGNKANRREFLNRFWYDEDGDGTGSQGGFLSYLKENEGRPVDWKEAVQVFNTALKKESDVREVRKEAWAAVAKFGQCLAKKRDGQEQLKVFEQLLKEAEVAKTEASRVLEQRGSILENAREERRKHLEFRPSWWIVLLTLGKAYRQWRQPDLDYQNRIVETEKASSDAQKAFSTAKTQYARITGELEECNRALAEVEVQIELLRTKIAQAQKNLGEHFVYNQEWIDDESRRELSSPWMDREWSLARTQVFFAALALHKAFIHSNATQFRQNFMALSDVLSGNLPGNASSSAVKASWDTLFFVIPVVSTTFASMDRLFPFHEKESIGWLFIDEAGQATPQAAVGGIWRARRAIVVGDPLQLEPILSLPFTAQDSLRKHFGVAENWRPGALSCQRLADQASHLGTWVKTDDEPLWVSSPLRVHRRCDELMFRISNHIAYGGMMVFGTSKRADVPSRPSSWFDVKSEQASDSHWIPEEGEVARKLLDELQASGIKSNDIFLISPFRSVVRGLMQIGRQYDGLRTGTIHTVQGKEAYVVILVLGGNPQKGGAKDWAAAKPNLLNVAASRAKRRLYVIGNRDEWRKRKYFNTLSAVFDDQIVTVINRTEE